ncbi:MAG: aminotransferase class V-fold PLP-dependent enzyme [Candidatus Bathyarchaeia archaeon]
MSVASMNLQSIRRKFPIVDSKIFLNHAGVSPLSVPVLDAIKKYLEKLSYLEDVSPILDEARSLFARLVNAKLGEVALVPNTSTGLNIAANVLEYPSGSNVVTTDLEYPSVVYPWLRRKLKPRVEVRYVRNVDGKLRLEDFEKMVDDRTVAVAVSHVEYANGFRNDLKAIAEVTHEHGAFLIVDACQSAGALRIDVKGDDVDFLATSCYKWLLGPAGAGFLYIRKDLIERSEPLFVGWASVKPEVFQTVELWENKDLRLSETASRFEVGEPSILSFVGAAAALRLIMEAGVERIERRILDLTGFLIERLKGKGFKLQTPEEPESRSGIVNLLVGNPEEKIKELRQRGIIVSSRMRGIRVSPHFYSTEDEIVTFVETIRNL